MGTHAELTKFETQSGVMMDVYSLASKRRTQTEENIEFLADMHSLQVNTIVEQVKLLNGDANQRAGLCVCEKVTTTSLQLQGSRTTR